MTEIPKVERLLRIIFSLSPNSVATTKDFVKQFGVSRRTIDRDANKLRFLGVYRDYRGRWKLTANGYRSLNRYLRSLQDG